jgi:hypothetical protein
MKVLFLDIDGVLNTTSTLWKLRTDGSEDIGSKHLIHLSRIVHKTGCKIVLSTSWRHFEPHIDTIKRRLLTAGIPNEVIISKTPDMWDDPRGHEITAWLKDHPEVTKFAVVDDDEDAGVLDDTSNFFKTSATHGLTSEIADGIISHLKEEVKALA